MTDNLYNNIKRQIRDQTRPHLNTKVNSGNVTSVNKLSGGVVLGDSTVTKFPNVSPIWAINSYSLNRGPVVALSPENFLTYSGSIRKTTLTQLGDKGVLDSYENLMYFTQVRGSQNSGGSIEVTVGCALGANAALYVQEVDSDVTIEGELLNGGYFQRQISLEQNKWYNIYVVYYNTLAEDSQQVFYLAITQKSGIDGWRIGRTNNLTHPQISSASYSVVRNDIAQGKVTLSWQKDITQSFGGNGVYRSTMINSGVQTSAQIPATLFKNLRGSQSINTFFTTPTNASLNSGDIISFNGETNADTYTIGNVTQIAKNHVVNPFFDGPGTNWALTNADTEASPNTKAKDYHVTLNKVMAATDTSVIVGTYISVSTASLYRLSFLSTDNLFDRRSYGLGGYGATPSRWASTGGVTSIEATTYKQSSVIDVTRNSSAGNIKSDATSLYLTSGTYSYQVTASNSVPATFSITFKNDTAGGSNLFTTPTLSMGVGIFKMNSGLLSVTTSGTNAYAQFNIPSASDYTSCKFGEIKIYNESANKITESVQIGYFDSSKNACSPKSFDLRSFNRSDTERGLYFRSLVFGSFSNATLLDATIPSDCVYIKPAFVYTNESGVTQLGSKRIHGVYLTDISVKEPYLSVASISMVSYSLTSPRAANTVTGSTVYFENNVLIFDRPKQPSDGSFINWDDTTVAENVQYKYKIDAYELTNQQSRTPLSNPALVTTGDTVPPKAPSSFNLTSNPGQINYSWTNPTANDLKYVKAFSDSGAVNMLFQASVTNATGKVSTFVEAYSGTGESITRYLFAYDASGNISPSVSATGTPTEVLTELSVTARIRNGWTGGSTMIPNENGWYQNGHNGSINASLQVTNPNIVASLFYNLKNVSVDTWSGYNEAINDLVQFSVQGRYQLKFRAKDIYGHIGPESPIINVNFDNKKPAWGSDKSSFWLPTSTSGAGWNRLVWDNSVISDTLSGVNKLHLKRGSYSAMTYDPGFEGQISPDLTGYRFTTSLSGQTAEVANNQSEAFYDNQYVRITSNYTTTIGSLNTTPLRLSNGDTFTAICRYCPASITSSASYKLYIRNTDSNAVLASINTMHTAASATYFYQQLDYTMSSSGTVHISHRYTYSTGNTSSYTKVDSLIGIANLVFATINEFEQSTTSAFNDLNVKPWQKYVYAVTPEDYSGIFGTISDYLFLRTKASQRDTYGNMLNNSSFEKYSLTASGTLRPDNWKWRVSEKNVAGSYTNYLESGSVTLQDSFDGNTCFAFFGNSLQVLAQNNINLLPYIGTDRVYTISFYAKADNPGTAYLGNTIAFFDEDNAMQVSKNIAYNALTSTWTRYFATLPQSVASISHASVAFYKTTTPTIYIDGVQFEESLSPAAGPTEYYDTTSVTVDYLQGNLIRGNVIEANSIYTNHLQSGSITADKLSALSVAASHMQANSIAGSQIQAGSIISSHLTANSVAASNIKSNSITAAKLAALSVAASNMQDNSIAGSQIQAGSIISSHLTPNSVAASNIKSNSITTGELNLADSIILIPGNDELRVESTGLKGTATMYGDVTFAMAGVSNYGLIHNVAGRLTRGTYDSANATIFIHTITDTFSYQSFAATGAKTSSNLGAGSTEPLLSREFPYTGTGRTLMVYGKVGSSPQRLQRTTSYHGTSPFSSASSFTAATTNFNTSASPTYIRLQASNLEEADLRYYNNNFYFGHKSYESSTRYRLYKLAQSGTLLTKGISNTFGAALNGFSFDVDSTGSILSAASKSSPTIFVHNWDANTLSRSPGTIEIETYSGSEHSVMYDISKANRRPVTNLSIVYATQNRYAITYRIDYSSFVYYKVISSSGTIYAGDGVDLPLTYYNVSKDDIGTANLTRMGMSRSYYTNPFLYISAIPTLDVGGHSKGGKATYLYPTSGTVNLVELLNRIA